MSEQHWSDTAPPVEATIRFAVDGFPVSLTIRADSGQDLMPAVSKSIAYLKEHGATPPPAQAPAAAGPAAQAGGSPTKVCTIHNVTMRRREKNGDAWYSHQAIDPDTGQEYYCKGKAKA